MSKSLSIARLILICMCSSVSRSSGSHSSSSSEKPFSIVKLGKRCAINVLDERLSHVCEPYISRQSCCQSGRSTRTSHISDGFSPHVFRNVWQVRRNGDEYHAISSSPTGAPTFFSSSQAARCDVVCSTPSGVSSGSGPQVISSSPLRKVYLHSQGWVSEHSKAATHLKAVLERGKVVPSLPVSAQHKELELRLGVLPLQLLDARAEVRPALRRGVDEAKVLLSAGRG